MLQVPGVADGGVGVGVGVRDEVSVSVTDLTKWDGFLLARVLWSSRKMDQVNKPVKRNRTTEITRQLSAWLELRTCGMVDLLVGETLRVSPQQPKSVEVRTGKRRGQIRAGLV